VKGEQQQVAAAAAAAAGGVKDSEGGAPIGLTGWGARKLWKVPTAASPVGLSATCCRRLFEPPSACALDTSRSRLLCADGYGIYGCRSSTLIDAECDVDCRTEGYSTFATHVRSVRLIDVCPGGRYIATASSLDEKMCILHECDALTGRRLSVARAYECPGGGRIEALRFSACATALAIGTHDHKVHVCMLADGKHLTPLLHDSAVCDIRTAVLPNNVGGLVSVCKDGSVWLWGLDRSRLLCVMRPHSTLKGSTKSQWAGHIGSILAADIRGGTMVTSGVDGTCKVWGLGLVMAGNAKNAQRQLGMRTALNPNPWILNSKA
jgi:WD40 repeat protein